MSLRKCSPTGFDASLNGPLSEKLKGPPRVANRRLSWT